MYPPKLYSGPTIQSRSAARRAAQDLVNTKKTKPIKHNSFPADITQRKLYTSTFTRLERKVALMIWVQKSNFTSNELKSQNDVLVKMHCFHGSKPRNSLITEDSSTQLLEESNSRKKHPHFLALILTLKSKEVGQRGRGGFWRCPNERVFFSGIPSLSSQIIVFHLVPTLNHHDIASKASVTAVSVTASGSPSPFTMPTMSKSLTSWMHIAHTGREI